MTKYLDQVIELQVELSNVCNAECLGCLRDSKQFKIYQNHFGKKYLKETLLIELFKTDAGKNIKTLEFCGNLDEPFAHPRFLEMLKSINEITTDLKISIHTNGTLRNTKYYKELAKILNLFKNHAVRFSIDGLKNSVYIYRGLKDYDKILDNAKSFIDNGGIAYWQMLSFPWNEIEVDKCRQMSQDMNFKKFVLRRDRSSASKMKVDDILQQRLAQSDIPSYTPLDLTKSISGNLEKLGNDYNNDTFDIICHFREEKKIFLDHSGRIWPCCFLANPEARNRDVQLEYEYKIYKQYGKDFNNLSSFSLDEILESSWFKKELTQSWNQKFKLDTGCLSTCIKQCSKNSIPIGHHLGEHKNES